MTVAVRIAVLAVAVFVTGYSGNAAQASEVFRCTMECAQRSSQALYACAEQSTDERCAACVAHRVPLCERCLTERCGLEDENVVKDSCAAHRSSGGEVCKGRKS